MAEKGLWLWALGWSFGGGEQEQALAKEAVDWGGGDAACT